MKLLHAIAPEYIFSSLSAQIALVAVSSNGLLAQPQKNATVQPAPFVKPHCVLIVADATVLLINRQTSVWLNCRQKIIKNDLLNSCQCDKIEISEI